MRKNLFFCLMLMASTLTIGLLAGCSEEVTVNNKDGDDPQLPVVCEDATVFASGTDSTRTSIYIVDGKALFYWVKKDNILVFENDNIWVDENGDNQFLLRSDTSELYNNDRFANFIFKNKNLSEPTYNLTYTGNGSTSGTNVTIIKQQEQKWKNNSSHIGTCGDCGVAKAVKEKGKYSFNLQHKAHYLIFQPYKDPFINGKLGNDTWTLKSIDIVDTDGIPLSGTFSFGMDGLDQTQEIENANDSVRIKCGPNGFVLPEQVDKDDNTKKVICYAVIAPAPNGQNRNLKIRYNIESSKISVNSYVWYNIQVKPIIKRWFPENPDYLPIIRQLSIPCKPNGVSNFKQGLGKEEDFGVISGEALTFSSNSFYTWDADENYYLWQGTWADYPSLYSNSTNPTYFGFNGNEETVTGTYHQYTLRRWQNMQQSSRPIEDPRSFNDVVWPDSGYNWEPYHATRSCLSMPDVNAASWYVMAGDPRLETEKIWCVNGDYRYVYTTGVWFKKWNEIPGKPEGSTPTNCPVSYNGTDYRTTPMPTNPMPFAIRDNNTGTYANAIPATEYKKGRPSKSEIDKYFFLPALGSLGFTNKVYRLYWLPNSIHSGQYWLSSSYPSDSMNSYIANGAWRFDYPNWCAYYLGFNKDAVWIYSGTRDFGRIAGKRKPASGVPTDDNWFQ